jgi:hypothetical protein
MVWPFLGGSQVSNARPHGKPGQAGAPIVPSRTEVRWDVLPVHLEKESGDRRELSYCGGAFITLGTILSMV